MNTENGRLLEKQVLPEDLIVDMRLPTPRMGVKTLGGTLVVAWRWDKHTGYHGGPAPFDSRRGAIAIPRLACKSRIGQPHDATLRRVCA
jgi:hypothetical protein